MMKKGYTIIELLVTIFILALGMLIIILTSTMSTNLYTKSNIKLKESFNDFAMVTTGIAGNESALEPPESKVSLKEYLNSDVDSLDVIEVWIYPDGRKVLVLKKSSF